MDQIKTNAADDSITKFIQTISEDRHHGASELARQALQFCAQSVEYVDAHNTINLIQQLRATGHQVSLARPSMASIPNLVNRWINSLADLESLALPDACSAAKVAAEKLMAESYKAVEDIVNKAVAVIGKNKCIITLSISSTILSIFEALKDAGIEVIVSESRPLNEGVLLAKKLSVWKIPTTIITDAQLGIFAAQADVALLGADTILANGDFANKAGSYLLALACREYGVPVYICCESFKQKKATDPEFSAESMSGDELGIESIPHVKAKNIYFETIPKNLVTLWLHE